MRRFFGALLIVALAACGKAMTGPVDSIPTDLLPNEGILRFTLATNCPAMSVAFGVDQFSFGPEDLSPGRSQDYRVGAGIHATSGHSFPSASVTFPSQTVTVIAKQRVVRTLACG